MPTWAWLWMLSGVWWTARNQSLLQRDMARGVGGRGPWGPTTGTGQGLADTQNLCVHSPLRVGREQVWVPLSTPSSSSKVADTESCSPILL